MTTADLIPLPTLLADLAGRFEERYPHAPVTEDTLQLYTELTLWDRYGVTDESAPKVCASRADIAAALADVPRDGTRAEYAARVRLVAQGVRL